MREAGGLMMICAVCANSVLAIVARSSCQSVRICDSIITLNARRFDTRVIISYRSSRLASCGVSKVFWI